MERRGCEGGNKDERGSHAHLLPSPHHWWWVEGLHQDHCGAWPQMDQPLGQPGGREGGGREGGEGGERREKGREGGRIEQKKAKNETVYEIKRTQK